MDLITVKLPGMADQALRDGSFFDEERALEQRYDLNRRARWVGRNGRLATVSLAIVDWRRVADYLDSLEGALAAGLGDNPDDDGMRSELRAVRQAIKRIDEAIRRDPDGA